MFFSILFVLIFTGCRGQNAKPNESELLQNQPKTDIQVNKEYDENGNLIRYDSSYSYYYSNIQNEPVLGDSLLNEFKGYFNNNCFFSKDPFFNDLFFGDSLMNFDFYTKDFFLNRFRSNTNRFNSLFLEMDSIKNHFFMNQFQDSIIANEKRSMN